MKEARAKARKAAKGTTGKGTVWAMGHCDSCGATFHHHRQREYPTVLLDHVQTPRGSHPTPGQGTLRLRVRSEPC